MNDIKVFEIGDEDDAWFVTGTISKFAAFGAVAEFLVTTEEPSVNGDYDILGENIFDLVAKTATRYPDVYVIAPSEQLRIIHNPDQIEQGDELLGTGIAIGFTIAGDDDE